MEGASSSRFQRAEELYHRALDLPKETRAAELERWCAGEPELLDEVRSLLDAFDEQRTVTVDGEPKSPKPRITDRRIGQMMGRYRIERELGRGGMGVVYLGTRSEGGIEQTVAIKVLSLLLTTRLHQDHFRLEGQILASLEHPNIAGMIDGGVGEDGEPYLVMEYVDGVRLDEYVDKHHTKVRDLVGLILQVCDGVHYAHRNLIVHRDLKPGNILVDAEGRPKLLDFGTAKLLNPADPTGIGRFTQQGFRAFTPEYASPEQILGRVVTAASDVYSLGVICYRLLTGHQPYRFSNYASSDFVNTITNYEPTRPSAALTGSAALARDAVMLPFDVHQRRRELQGDLDAIVLKAMAKEPERRYQTAAELADDLRNYLAARPVAARESNWPYLSGKFVQRNRAQVISAAAVAVAIAAGLGATVWQANVARAEESRAVAQFQNVRKLNRFLLIDFYNEVETLPGSTGVQKDLLTQSLVYLDRLQRESPDDPEVLLDIIEAYTKMGDLQGNPYSNNLSDPEAAIVTLKKALALAAPLKLRKPPPERALLRYAHVEQSLGEVYFGKGDVPSASVHLEAAAAAFEEIANRPGAPVDALPEAGAIYGVLGDMYGGSFVSNLEAGRAEGYFRKGLDLNLRALKIDPKHMRARRGVAISKLKLGTVLQDVRTLEAIPLFEAGLAETRALATPGRSNFQNLRLESLMLNHLAYSLTLVGRYEEAIKYGRQAVSINESFVALDPTNQRALIDASTAWFFCGNAIHARVEALGKAEDKAETMDMYQKALRALETVLKTQPGNGIWNSTVIELNNRMGTLSISVGQSAAADRYFSEAHDRAILLADPSSAIESILQKAALTMAYAALPPEKWDLPRAVTYGERLNRKTGFANPDHLVVLARIYRLSSRLAEARDTIEKANALVPQTNPGEPVTELRKQIELERSLLAKAGK